MFFSLKLFYIGRNGAGFDVRRSLQGLIFITNFMLRNRQLILTIIFLTFLRFFNGWYVARENAGRLRTADSGRVLRISDAFRPIGRVGRSVEDIHPAAPPNRKGESPTCSLQVSCS